MRRARQDRMDAEGRTPHRDDRGNGEHRSHRDELADIDTSAVDDLKI